MGVHPHTPWGLISAEIYPSIGMGIIPSFAAVLLPVIKIRGLFLFSKTDCLVVPLDKHAKMTGFSRHLMVDHEIQVQSLWVPRGTGPEFYPSNDGKNPSFGRVFPSKPGLFPSQTNVQSLWAAP